jgi:hypothetical protein
MKKILLFCMCCLLNLSCIYAVEFLYKKSNGAYVFSCDANIGGKIAVKFHKSNISITGSRGNTRWNSESLSSTDTGKYHGKNTISQYNYKNQATSVAKYKCGESNVIKVRLTDDYIVHRLN